MRREPLVAVAMSVDAALDAAGPRARVATRIVFFVVGVAVSSWAPLVPYAQAHAGLDAATLGLVLLCFGAGSLVAMPLAGGAVDRFGCRRVIVVSAVTAVAMLPLLATLAHAVAVAAALLVFGAALGAVDVAMNLQAIAVERASGRTMMSGFHGLYSVGGIGGSTGVATALTLGMPVATTTVLVAALATVLVASAVGGLSTARSAPTARRFFVPRGIVLLIGLLGFAAFLMEGAVLDWSAVFLTTIRDVPVARAGAGYVAFSIAMTAGRFVGDRVVRRFGGRRVLVAGALLAACGAVLVALVPSWPVALAGFAVVGLGCSNIVPVLFSAAGRQTAMPESVAVPAMTTMSYAGLLAGPAAIGFVSSAIGLPLTFVGLAAMLVAVAVAGSRLRA